MRSRSRTTRPLSELLLSLACLALCACASPPSAEAPAPAARASAEPVVALWVSRWDHQTPEDVRRVMDNALSIGVTDVLWQVRGSFDAVYPSPFEPWAEPPEGRAVDPGFDPLAAAIEAAQERGLRLHAWVNVLTIARGFEDPATTTHPFHVHPTWRLYDQAGRGEPVSAGYRLVNPALDAVHDHIVAVVHDLDERYELDGVHLDWLWFPWPDRGGRLFPGDAATLEMFARATGFEDAGTPRRLAAYAAWLRDRVTRLARRIRAEAVGPGTTLSVLSGPNPGVARERALQDAAAWLEGGVVDRVYARVAGAESADVAATRGAWLDAGLAVTPVIPVRVASTPEAAGAIVEAAWAGGEGIGLFAYAAIFESVDPAQARDPAAVTDRLVARQALRDWSLRAFPGAAQ